MNLQRMADTRRRCYLCQRAAIQRVVSAICSGAHNSAVECHLHTVEVVGSNPAVPTNVINRLASATVSRFATIGLKPRMHETVCR